MHSASYRTNAILTMAFSGLVALCVAVSLTGEERNAKNQKPPRER